MSDKAYDVKLNYLEYFLTFWKTFVYIQDLKS